MCREKGGSKREELGALACLFGEPPGACGAMAGSGCRDVRQASARGQSHAQALGNTQGMFIDRVSQPNEFGPKALEAIPIRLFLVSLYEVSLLAVLELGPVDSLISFDLFSSSFSLTRR